MGNKGRILMVSSRIPYPLTAGFRIRIYNEAKYAKKAGYDVDLLYLGEAIYQKELKEVFSNVYAVRLGKVEAAANLFASLFTKEPFQVALYRSREAKAKIEAMADGYDVIIGNHIRTVEWLTDIPAAKVLIDLHDAISYNYMNAQKLMHGVKKLVYKEEAKRVLSYECSVVNKYKNVVIISESDREHLQKNGADTSRMAVIPVAVRDDINNIKSDYNADENMLCFLGKMSYQPNIDACVWFAQNVFGRLREKYRDLRFVIMGIEPAAAVRELEKMPGIKVTGFLENPYEIIERAKAMVTPIRNGAGIQNKILESMVVGTPTVISPIAAEGLRGKAGEDFLLADTPCEYVEKLSELIEQADRREQIGRAGRKMVEAGYTWSATWSMWEQCLENRR